MSHARVEELSDSSGDSDPEIMDPTSLDALAPSLRTHHHQQPTTNPSLISPQSIPTAHAPSPNQPTTPPAAHKTWHVLYPVYFDAALTREQGRRVAKELAVRNPLAQGIAVAVRANGLMSVFEPAKVHPRDWANPGRVRVQLRDEGGRWVARGVKNSMFTVPERNLSWN
jgi:signal recognition particle subunit SRP19